MASPERRVWKPKPDPFLIGMFVAVGLTWIFPNPGAEGGWLQPALLNKLGVALIFFLHGAALSFKSLKEGTLRWPLHLLVQSTTFVVFPLLGLLIALLGSGFIDADLRMGLFFLCALPSTVSSSVAMTAAARGNVPAAVFNATLSSLLGVVITPLLVGWLIQSGGHGFPLGKVMLDLVLWLLLPLALGQLARPVVGGWISRHKPIVHLVDRGTILLLVYTSFCDSVKSGVWSGHGVRTLITAFLICAAIFGAVLLFTGAVADRLGFNREDRIAAVFCGSKKTLASGVPMARLIFGASPTLSVILLPIMLYHPLQLFVCGILATRWARQSG
ncbi:bile acid:sodium symporter [bacterium]|nr:MAG: bile acid:sodium symporter [bacterium]